jgi:hypothetical protein
LKAFRAGCLRTVKAGKKIKEDIKFFIVPSKPHPLILFFKQIYSDETVPDREPTAKIISTR